VVYSLSRVIVRAILRLLFGFRVDGGEHEPPTGPVVVVSNHVSYLDPLVVGSALRRRVAFMAKEELFRLPVLGAWVTACGGFPVRRGEADHRALRTALGILSRGGILVMFPEGTRGEGRVLRPPEPGAAMLALRAGAAILPVALLGTDHVLPRGGSRLRRGTIRVRIGPPLHLDGEGHADGEARPGRAEIDALGRRYMGEIARLMA
jgi:1-acyl-sn-glycerol-3-phosphate acyltransferase